jgi:3-phenylpropionate/cinnamic acid dioxygenase small subunit
MNNIDAIRTFVELEADMLDFKQFHEWLALWDEDGLYVVPIDAEPDSDDFEDKLNFAYDDSHMRRLRVERLMSGEAVSSETTMKTVRSVSRLRVLEESPGKVELRCAQFIAENRHGNLRTYPADVSFTLRRHAGGFSIVRKVVRLLHSHNALASIGYIL